MNTPDPVEQVLKKYRPAGPPAALRQRVLAGARASRAARRWRPSPFWLAIAAMLVVAVGLHWATQDLSARTTRTIGIGPVEWNESAEQAADLLGDDLDARSLYRPGADGQR